MSKLLEKRRKITQMAVPLINQATKMGHRPVLDFVKRCEGCKVGHVRSCHKVGLAIDLHLYYPGTDTYIEDDTGHRELHEYWTSMGGAPMIEWDANHYSLEWEGMT